MATTTIIDRMMDSSIRLRALLRKEFRLLLRDPRMRFFVVVPPIVQLIIFGYAAAFDVRHAVVGVVDQSQSQLSRELLTAVTATDRFSLRRYANMSEARAAVDRSQIRAVMHIPADFARHPAMQLIADGSDSNSAQIIVGELSQLIREVMAHRSGRHPPIEVEDRAWFNPNLEDRAYFVPGIMANVVLIATLILTAISVVREREMGTLERLLVTPVGRLEFLLGKLIPVGCVGLFDVILISMIAILWFDVPFRGDFFSLIFASLLFLTSSLGLGLLVSSYASTQQQAVLTAFFFVMPMVILSGFAFPIRNMPEWVQLITWLDPLRYFLVIIRDLFLKGGGIYDYPFEFGMMTLLGLGAILLSMLRIR